MNIADHLYRPSGYQITTDTEENWTAVNPVVPARFICVSVDSNQAKIHSVVVGDGKSTWQELVRTSNLLLESPCCITSLPVYVALAEAKKNEQELREAYLKECHKCRSCTKQQTTESICQELNEFTFYPVKKEDAASLLEPGRYPKWFQDAIYEKKIHTGIDTFGLIDGMKYVCLYHDPDRRYLSCTVRKTANGISLIPVSDE
jgi:hypothetical protein